MRVETWKLGRNFSHAVKARKLGRAVLFPLGFLNHTTELTMRETAGVSIRRDNLTFLAFYTWFHKYAEFHFCFLDGRQPTVDSGMYFMNASQTFSGLKIIGIFEIDGHHEVHTNNLHSGWVEVVCFGAISKVLKQRETKATASTQNRLISGRMQIVGRNS